MESWQKVFIHFSLLLVCVCPSFLYLPHYIHFPLPLPYSSALVDVVAPPMRLPSNTCSLSGDLPQLAKLLGRGKENANFCSVFFNN